MQPRGVLLTEQTGSPETGKAGPLQCHLPGPSGRPPEHRLLLGTCNPAGTGPTGSLRWELESTVPAQGSGVRVAGGPGVGPGVNGCKTP